MANDSFQLKGEKTQPVEDLVRQAQRGNERAWRALVDRYARLVHSVPVRYGLAPDEVDDVGQEVFLALARNLHTIEDPTRLPAWLVTTARRASWRLRSRYQLETTGLTADLSDTNTGAHHLAFGRPAPTLEELLAGWGRQELLQQALAQLRDRCRQLITLLFFSAQEPSYDDIALALDMSKGSIGPTRSRCLAQLRAILEGLGWADDDLHAP